MVWKIRQKNKKNGPTLGPCKRIPKKYLNRKVPAVPQAPKPMDDHTP